MNGSTKNMIAVAAVAAAVIAGAVAYVKNGMSREAEARLLAEAAASEEAKAEAVRKTEKAAAEKASAEAKAAEAKAAAEADAKEAARMEKESAELKLKAESENRKAKEAALKVAEAERAAAKLEAAAAADRAKSAAAGKEKAKALENAEALKAAAEADRLAAEKLRSEKVIAEAKALELMKIDFETLERDLMEFKQELDERERALKPEKTVADLAWVGGTDDKVVDEKGNLRVLKKEPYLAENDKSLPRATRKLAKLERELSEEEADRAAKMKADIVSLLESMYVRALREDRVVDAEFYRKNLKSLYPGWEFKGGNNKNGDGRKK